MEEMITVGIEGKKYSYKRNTTFEEIANDYQERYDHLITVVIADGKIRELIRTVEEDCTISFITRKDVIGQKTYERTATLLLVKAIHDVAGAENIEKIKVEYTIGNGLYCSGHGNFAIDEVLVEQIKERMEELVKDKAPISKRTFPLDEAVKLFRRNGMKDKEKLFRYRRSSSINVYDIEGFSDYFYGYMLPSADYVNCFELKLYGDGFLLLLPNSKEPNKITPFEPREQFFKTLQKSSEWGIRLGIDTVADLNDRICEGGLSDLILVQEALQERRIGEIAKEIAERQGVKFVMIAGPSSSGKTTFSHRLSIQLRTLGLVPHPIALDNYFVNRDRTPIDENGDYDFECLEAIDVEQFNHDMSDLLAGKEVELPSFDFKKGMREYKGDLKKLGKDDILVIEGIHGLNNKMSYALPSESKFKIYISALTTLNIDEHNRIPTTDARLLRRMVRDARTRGTCAKRTIQMWSSVRNGEEKYIFPLQESADAMFNSTLIYELAVIKQFAEPLLFSVKKGEPEYHEAKRMLKFLEYFLGVSSENLPNNSIIREFVGGSCFNV